jgi:hypothetical protein
MCVLCRLELEFVDHLFGPCNKISSVWYDILLWLGVELVPPRQIFFEAFMSMGKKDKFRWLLVWPIIVWTIWKYWNDAFFFEGIFSVECLVDRVKFLSWKWFQGKNSSNSIPFTSWLSIWLYDRTDKVCWSVVLGLDGSGELVSLLLFFPKCGWSLSLSSPEGFSSSFSSRGGTF